MADTARTITDLLDNLFQDGQAASSITPNDLRDFIVSVQTSVGAFHLSTAIETSIITQGVAVKIAGSTLGFASNVDFTVTDNRLTYDGTLTKTFLLEASMTFQAASNNQTLGLSFGVNGIVNTTTIQQQRMGATADPFTISLTAHLRLVKDDFLEIFVSNETSTGNVTANFMNVTVVSVFSD